MVLNLSNKSLQIKTRTLLPYLGIAYNFRRSNECKKEEKLVNKNRLNTLK